MSLTHILRCDECGEKFVYGDTTEKDGWIEVWTNEDTSLDFCDQQCMIDYFTKEEEE